VESKDLEGGGRGLFGGSISAFQIRDVSVTKKRIGESSYNFFRHFLASALGM
jgi:hypothetical protein